MFYTRAIAFLEALEIDTEQEEPTKEGWKQIKMMFEGEDQQTLQTLIENYTITPVKQKSPQQVPETIATTMKTEEHFWHLQDEHLSDVFQCPK